MTDAPLSLELERALMRELVIEWKRLNEEFFRGTLRLPSLELSETEGRLGCWNAERRAIELSRSALLTHGWGVVSEVLKHEMAHQYVSEVLRETDQTSHGPAFRSVCQRLGIDGAARGLPNAAADEGDKRLIDRIARLLALAESPNAHEAEAAASAAQRLMLKYNLDVAGGHKARGYGFLHVGKPSGRVTEAERILAMILGRYYFVEVIWVPVYRVREGKRGTVLELCGSEANLAMAEYVHAFLTNTAEQLWVEHKRAAKIRANRDRRVFLAGVMTGFADKLARENVKHREEGLVWVKDADLGGYFRKRHPRVRHVRYAGTRKNEAYAHGKAAGQRIVLRKGVSAGAESRGLMLPGGSGSLGRMAKPKPLPFDADAALAHLHGRDRVLSRLIERVGPFALTPEGAGPPFESLTRSILHQQVTGAAAAAILRRFREGFGEGRAFPRPERVARLSDEELRAAGVSRTKAAALRDLAAKTLDGTVPTSRALLTMSDEAIVERLTQVRGVGVWTVHMLLMFRLGRPDVLPVGDYGVRKGFAKTFRTRPAGELPTPAQLARRAERWRPYRSVASWYLWRALEVE